MTRCKIRLSEAKHAWTGDLPFPNPFQSIMLALGIGLAFLLGGSGRLASPTYSVIREYGGDAGWGMGFLAVSIGLFGAWRWIHHGLFAAYVGVASAYLLFALAIGTAAWQQPTVSWIAVVVFTWLAWVHGRAAKDASGEWRIERWLRTRWGRVRGHMRWWWRRRHE